MKTNQWAALSAAVSISCAALPSSASGQTQPSIPVANTFTAFPTVVQTGTKPTITWDITYPSTVTEVVTITTTGTVTPKQDLYMDVRVLGASIGDGNSWYMVQSDVKADSSSWTQFFKMKQSSVNPSTIYYTKLIRNAQTINFRGKVASNNSSNPSTWQSTYTTGTTTNNVRVLVNGDTPPSYVPAFSNQGTIKSILSPYLVNGKIKIGPMDVIYLFELWGTATNQSYFDMQDLVILTTFRKI